MTEQHETLRLLGVLFPIAVGLGSSFTHCAGMCGPIHFYLVARRKKEGGGREGYGTWFYHAGRISGYGLLGAAMGTLGQGLSASPSPLYALTATIALALAYALFGLGLLGALPAGLNPERVLGFLYPARLSARFSPLSSLSSLGGGGKMLFPAGLVASLLPCPSTHAVLLWCLGLDSAWKASLAMLFMGVSTLPVFAVISRGFARRPAFAGPLYKGMLGMAFLGLSAWRIYGIATQSHPACH